MDEIYQNLNSQITNISDQVGDLRVQVGQLVTTVDMHCKWTKELIDKHERILHGHNGSPGVISEVEDLKKSHKFTKWIARSTLGALISIIVGWAIKLKFLVGVG